MSYYERIASKAAPSLCWGSDKISRPVLKPIFIWLFTVSISIIFGDKENKKNRSRIKIPYQSTITIFFILKGHKQIKKILQNTSYNKILRIFYKPFKGVPEFFQALARVLTLWENFTLLLFSLNFLN